MCRRNRHPQAPPVLAIGLMSGTSQDGVDVALIETDGEAITRFGQTAYRPYSKDERALLRSATAAAANLTDRTARPGVIAEAEQRLNAAHAEAVETFLAANGVAADAVTVIGFHGQTVLHRPERGLTVQIGDGSCAGRAARHSGGLRFSRRRRRRRRAGRAAGAGVSSRAGAAAWMLRAPVAVLNIGGVANVTYIDGEDLIACDTGPGNALLDDFLRLRTGQPLDTDGRAAAAGVVDETAVARVLAASVLCENRRRSRSTATISRLGRRGAGRSQRRGRRGDADRAHRGSGRAHRAACCRARRRPGSSPAAARATRR